MILPNNCTFTYIFTFYQLLQHAVAAAAAAAATTTTTLS